MGAANFRSLANRAASFAGDSNSYALAAHSSSLNLSDLTMIAVVKPKAFYSGPCQNSQILSKGYPHNIPGNYGIGFTDNIYDYGDCSAFDATKQQLASQLGNNGGASTPLMPGNYLGLSDWYFLATTYGSGQINYYQVVMTPAQQFTNIQPIYSATSSSPVGTNAQPISLGRHLNPAYPYQFNGAMDEVILFNRALTTAEIQTVYNFIWAPPVSTSVDETSAGASAVELRHNGGLLALLNLNSTVRTVRVTNTAGQTIYRGTGAQVRSSIDLSTHRAQVLFVQIQSTEGIETIKFFND